MLFYCLAGYGRILIGALFLMISRQQWYKFVKNDPTTPIIVFLAGEVAHLEISRWMDGLNVPWNYRERGGRIKLRALTTSFMIRPEEGRNETGLWRVERATVLWRGHWKGLRTLKRPLKGLEGPLHLEKDSIEKTQPVLQLILYGPFRLPSDSLRALPIAIGLSTGPYPLPPLSIRAPVAKRCFFISAE